MSGIENLEFENMLVGRLLGSELRNDEEDRVLLLDDPEIVLHHMPLKLFIAVDSTSKELPLTNWKRIYALTIQANQSSLDADNKVRIRRHGFPIVPDIGGIAHAYCGTTMEAAIGDLLLPWYQEPRLDDMLKGYIIKSPVRHAEKLLLAQPYSPHLFRQGSLPGPQLLLDVLMKKTTSE